MAAHAPRSLLPASVRLLIAHNDYGRPSGEEHALETLADMVRYALAAAALLRMSERQVGLAVG